MRLALWLCVSVSSNLVKQQPQLPLSLANPFAQAVSALSQWGGRAQTGEHAVKQGASQASGAHGGTFRMKKLTRLPPTVHVLASARATRVLPVPAHESE